MSTRGTALLRPALTALPGLVLGVAGLFHPMHLTDATAHRWWTLHVPGMFVFPLVGVAVASLVWPRRSPLAVAVVVLAFVWGVAYNALDILAGMGAGYLTEELGGSPRPRAVSALFGFAADYGRIGALALVLAGVLVTVDGWRRAGARGLAGGVVLVLGAVLVARDHIMVPWGALGITLVGLGSGALAWATGRRTNRSS